MNWSFFQRRLCLTNNEAEWQIAQAEFNRVGLEVEKYQAVKEIGPHQSFSHSERNILLDFLYSDAETLLHLAHPLPIVAPDLYRVADRQAEPPDTLNDYSVL